MINLVTVEEMRAIEKEGDANGVPYTEMMERAGNGLAHITHQCYFQQTQPVVLALVGSGNNGGDALVALAEMIRLGWQGRAYLVRERPNDDPLLERVRQAGGQVFDLRDDPQFELLDAALEAAGVLLDGVLGTGIKLPVYPELEQVLRHVQGRANKPAIVAVDCPSGVNCDTGEASPAALSADLTICMDAVKKGLLKFPAFALCGRIATVDLGLPENLASRQNIRNQVLSSNFVRKNLPARPLDAHKGTFGTAMVVAGSINYNGAALLAGEAAYRSGAGLVCLAVARPVQQLLAASLPEAIWLPLDHKDGFIAAGASHEILSNLDRITAVLIGPGMGNQPATADFVEKLVDSSKAEALRKIPLVLDADGLRLVTRIPGWPDLLPSKTVLTPHPGEMSALTDLSVPEILANREKTARKYARQWGHIVVLKGAFTIIASPNGSTWTAALATPALATAGTGDVLAGLITGLLAQGVPPLEAAGCAVWIYGQAGLKAAEKMGQTASVLAGDVLRAVPEVLRELYAPSCGIDFL